MSIYICIIFLKKISLWFSSDLRRLLTRLLHPKANIRITIGKLVELEHQWFKKGHKPPAMMLVQPHGSGSLKMCNLPLALSRRTMKSTKWNTLESPLKPTSLNAFDIISRSKGFDLSDLFENDQEQKS
jgi:5'-AMP-activated protein kinase, catalytic alpha subunit